MNKNFNPNDDDMFGDPEAKARAELSGTPEAEAKAEVEAKSETNAKAKADAKTKADKAASDSPKWDKVSTAPADGWSKVSLDAGKDEIPPNGIYKGVLEVRIRDKGSVLWLSVNYHLDGHAARPRGDMGPLLAVPASEHYHRVGDGRRLLRRLAMATGRSGQNDFEVDDIVPMFDGCQVRLRVHKRVREGVPELIVSEILPA